MADNDASVKTGIPVVQYQAGELENVSTYVIGGSTTAPTAGSGATYYRRTTRDGEYALIRYEFSQTGGGVAGSGAYRFPLPPNLTANTAKLAQAGTTSVHGVVGWGRVSSQTSDYIALPFISGLTANSVQVNLMSDTQAIGAWGSALVPLSGTTIVAAFEVRIPILEWAGNAYAAYGAGLATANTPGLIRPRKEQYDLTISSAQAGFTKTRAQAIYYQDQLGAHRLKFNLGASFTSATVTSVNVTMTGVVFKNVASYFQSISGFFVAGSNGAFLQAYVNPNSGDLTLSAASTTTATRIFMSGDVELESKPTWA